MARIIAEGSGKGFEHEQTPNAATLSPGADGRITLPEGVDLTALDLARQGQDLVLTTPDGQTFIVENYFLMPDAPAIVSEGGSVLSPALVHSFLKSAGDVQVAATEQANDASPVGEITEVSGNATVTHADGTKEAITAGTQIFEGDIVETDAKGAVNIKFADDSTFAVSENGRLAVDDFSFNPADQSGTTGLSVLRGVFMFTSGLIGRENPDAVNLETPVGSIGIRGTIIGGQIIEGGKSQISVLEGAIVVRNGTGEQILSSQFETVQLTGFNNPISNMGQLNAGQMTQSYGAVRSVSQNLFTSIDDTAREPQQQQPQGEQQQPTDQPAQDKGANAQAPGDAAAQQTAPAPTGEPVFQTLNTGSNLDHGTTTQPAVTAPAATPSQPVVTAPVVTAPAPVVTTPVTVDQPAPLAPGAARFVTGGSVVEESASGLVVGTIGMAQNASFPVTYTLLTGTDRFTIDAKTGVVTQTQRAGDYDTGTTHYDLSVRITRTDTGQHTDTGLTVGVTPVDENPTLLNPAFTVAEGGTTVLTAAMIGATDPENTNGLTYTSTGITHGTIEMLRGGNWSAATTFTHADLVAGRVRFTHDGGEMGAGLNLKATDQGGHDTLVTAVAVTVTPVNDAPVQQNYAAENINEGTAKIITNLNWSDPDNTPAQIVYTITGATSGWVEFQSGGNWNTLAAGGTFTQADLNAGIVRFQHDGSETGTSGFTYSVTDGAVGNTGQQTFPVTPVNDLPVLDANDPLTVSEGGSTVIDTLKWRDTDNTAEDIIYTLTGTAHGGVEIFDNNMWTRLEAGDQFSQAKLDAGGIRFTHDGSETTGAAFSYTVSDGIAAGQPGAFNLAVSPVNDLPVHVADLALNVGEGMDTIINGLQWADADNTPGEITYTFASGTNGSLEKFNGVSWIAIAAGDTFTQANLNAQKIRFVHDGSETTAASFDYTVTDGTAPAATGTFNLGVLNINDAPTVSLPTYANIAERAGGASETVAMLSITDGEAVGGNIDYSFQVQRYNGTAWVNETRFEVVADGNDWKLKTITNASFDHETAGGLSLRVVLTDGTNTPVSTGTLSVEITDVNEAATDFHLNRGNTFDNTYDAVVTGNSLNGYIGRLSVDDPDTNAAFRPLAANYYSIESVTGAFTDKTLFSIQTLNLNGIDVPVLRFAGVVAPNFAVQQAFNITVKVDADMNGSFNDAADLTQTWAVIGRNDVTAISAFDNAFYTRGSNVMRSFDATTGSEIAIVRPQDGKIVIQHNEVATDISYIVNIPVNALTHDAVARAISISGSRDLNGDGYGDLIIGASTAGAENQGSVAIVLGGSNSRDDIDYNSASLIHLAPADKANTRFGSAVSALGDVNGDGFADFAVGAPGVDTNGVSAGGEQGQVYLYFGSANMTAATLDATKTVIHSTQANDQIGATISAGGDFNGDGFADFLITQHGTDNGQGSVRIVLGNAGMANGGDISLASMSGSVINWGAADSSIIVGANISRAGDFNGDGFGDAVIDVAKSLGENLYEHTLYVVYGSATPSAAYNLSSLSTSLAGALKIKVLETTGLALDLTPAGDQNGDGYDDLLIGNPNVDGDTIGGAAIYGGAYDGKVRLLVSDSNATGNNTYYAGGTLGTTLYDNGKTNLTFRAGDGNDTFEIRNVAAVGKFMGGSGTDTLRLFFSEGESTPEYDLINLSGTGSRFDGVDRIVFQGDSRNDTLKLDIADILHIAKTSDNASLIIGTDSSATDLKLDIFNSSTLVSSLTSLTGMIGLTRDANADGTADTRMVDGNTYNVYTNVAQHVEFLVDTRITVSAV